MTIKLKSEQKGDHIHERVYVGTDRDHLALAGELVFRVGEWQLFGCALLLGAGQMRGHLEVITEGEPHAIRDLTTMDKEVA